MAKMLEIEYGDRTTNLGGYDADDPWSRDSTRSDYTVTGAKIAGSKSRYGACPISDCEVGDKIYVIWADYQTGDTFGSDSAIEFLAAFKSEAKARRCFDKANHKTKDSGWDIQVELDDGTQYTVHIPWLGYFEHLEELHMTEVTVTE